MFRSLSKINLVCMCLVSFLGPSALSWAGMVSGDSLYCSADYCQKDPLSFQIIVHPENSDGSPFGSRSGGSGTATVLSIFTTPCGIENNNGVIHDWYCHP